MSIETKLLHLQSIQNLLTPYRYLYCVYLERDMAAVGQAGTDTHRAVMSEIAHLHKQLGFLVDADNFYRKPKILIDVMSWLRSKLK